VYQVIPSADYQVLRDGLVDEEAVVSTLRGYGQAVKTFKPDVIIGDANLLAGIVAQRYQIPIAQIVQYAYHPKGGQIIWWESLAEQPIPPRSTRLFNPLLERMRLEPISEARDLFRGDVYLVPNIPDLEPFSDPQTIHVGELTLSEVQGRDPDWLQELERDQPVVFVTLGGGSSNAGRHLLSAVMRAFEGERVQVIVATGNRADPRECRTLSRNIRVFRWVPGRLVVARADLVLFHGGYGTMVESVACGKPSIVVPFHSEQEGNGRRLELAGCGVVLPLSRETFETVKRQWKYGVYTSLVQHRWDLEPEEIVEKTAAMLATHQYALNAQKLQRGMEQYRGSAAAIDAAEQLWA
jgi:UDP:flavonoid glycosyltransferase YjiC (YdhE family)